MHTTDDAFILILNDREHRPRMVVMPHWFAAAMALTGHEQMADEE
jgi:hypothetical protein